MASGRVRTGDPVRIRAAAVLCALALGGCGAAGADGADGAAVADRVDQAREETADALKQVALLEERVAELESTADEVVLDDDPRLRKLGTRLDRLTERLTGALRRLTRRISDADAAASEGASALAEARSVARDLAVLEQRLGYHLRGHEGGSNR